MGGSLPDAFAKLIVNGKVILETPVQSNTLTPTWPDQKKANYHVPSGASAKVELWDPGCMPMKKIKELSAGDLEGGTNKKSILEYLKRLIHLFRK